MMGTRENTGKAGMYLLCQLVVGEGVGVGSLAVEFLLGELHVAALFHHVGFTVVFALLALA